MELTTILERQVIFTILAILFSVGMSLYSIYLNYKQAKVKRLMEDLIEEVKGIHNTLKKDG